MNKECKNKNNQPLLMFFLFVFLSSNINSTNISKQHRLEINNLLAVVKLASFLLKRNCLIVSLSLTNCLFFISDQKLIMINNNSSYKKSTRLTFKNG